MVPGGFKEVGARDHWHWLVVHWLVNSLQHPPTQPPQNALLVLPQPSGPVTPPQAAPASLQICALVLGVHTHWLLLQVLLSRPLLVGQLPHVTVFVPPHPSLPVTVPHVAPALEQTCALLYGEHVHWLLLHVLLSRPPLVWQLPQDMVREAPQRSCTVIEPQVAPFAEQSCAFVSGVQTHWLLVHCSFVPQLPQLMLRV